MNGVHLVCGYATEGHDNQDDGYNLANYLIAGQTVRQSWFNAIDVTEPNTTMLRVIAEDSTCFNDHIWGKGSVASDPQVNDMVSTRVYYCT